MATASMRTNTSPRFGVGTGFSPSFSSPGPPRIQALIVEGTGGDFAAVIVSSGKTILSRSLLANQSEDRLQPLEIMVRLRRQSQYPIFRYFLDNDDERDRHWLELVAANAKTEGWVGDRFA
jgi:hypothetical protein